MTTTIRAAVVLAILGTCLVRSVTAAETREFKIESQALSQALVAFSEQSQLVVTASSDLLAGKKAPAIYGEMAPEEALGKLLEGSGLRYVKGVGGDITVVLVGANKQAAAEGKPIAGVGREGEVQVAEGDMGGGEGSGDRESMGGGTEERGKLDEVVVTAQKRTERLQDVPIPVTAISGDTLVDNNQLRLQDYYSSIPGLNLAPITPSEQYLSIRGVSSGVHTNQTVAVVVDDVPVGASTYLGGGDLVPDIDPGDLARLEVLRGPQGTLYGASSMGGLLKFVTLDPSTDRVSGNAQVGTSSIHNGAELGYNFRGSINVPVSDTLAIRASGFTRRDPGYIDNPVLHINGINETRVSGGLFSSLWRPSQAFSLKLLALYQDTRADGWNDADVQPGLGDLQQNYIPGTGQNHRQLQAYGATLNAKLGSIDLTAVSGYSVNAFSDSNDYTGAFGAFSKSLFGVTGTRIAWDNKTKKFTQEIRLSAPIGQRFEWLFGGFYTHEDSAYVDYAPVQDPTGATVGSLATIPFPRKFEEYAAFSDLTFHVTDRFNVQIGGRESRITQIYPAAIATGPLVGGTNVGPALSGTSSPFTYLVTPQFKMSANLMAYARLASGYRPGGLQYAGSACKPNDLLCNPNLPHQVNPDKTKNYEIGVKGDFLDHTLSIDSSLYYIDWKDMQITLLDPVTHGQYGANGSGAKSQGLELSVESRPLTGLKIGAWVVWDKAVLTEAFPPTSTAYGPSGTRLPYSSRFSGNVSVEDEFRLTGGVLGFVGGAVSYVGDRKGDFTTLGAAPQQDLPAYAKTDLCAGARYDSWTLTLSVANAFDKRGLLLTGLLKVHPEAFVYIPPRTVGLSLSKAF